MALPLAVFASVRVDTLLGAVACTVARLLTVHALKGRLRGFVFENLLLAVLVRVSLETAMARGLIVRGVFTLRICPSSPQLPHNGTPQS
jgi:hypothetical protein